MFDIDVLSLSLVYLRAGGGSLDVREAKPARTLFGNRVRHFKFFEKWETGCRGERKRKNVKKNKRSTTFRCASTCRVYGGTAV